MLIQTERFCILGYAIDPSEDTSGLSEEKIVGDEQAAEKTKGEVTLVQKVR